MTEALAAYWVVGLINVWLRLPRAIAGKPHCLPQNRTEHACMTAILCVVALAWPVVGPIRRRPR